MFTTALALAASLLTAAPVADLSVDLDARSTLLLPGARYDVSITNHGPDPITSATVVVQLEYPVMSGATAPCALDSAAKTLTCAFGPLPVGASATMSALVYYLINGAPRPVNATATRTAGAPPDPNPANDMDTRTCWFQGSPGMPPAPWPPPLSC